MIVLMEGNYNGRSYPFAVFSTKKLATKTLRELGYKYSKFDECFINDKSRKYVHMEFFILDKMPPMLESEIGVTYPNDHFKYNNHETHRNKQGMEQ